MNQGPVAVTFENGTLSVAFCKETAATRIVAYQKDGDWEPIWRAEGTPLVGVGEVLSASTLSDRFDAVTLNDELSSTADGLDVVLRAEDARSNLTASFSLPSQLPKKGEWLKPDGSVADSPCG